MYNIGSASQINLLFTDENGIFKKDDYIDIYKEAKAYKNTAELFFDAINQEHRQTRSFIKDKEDIEESTYLINNVFKALASIKDCEEKGEKVEKVEKGAQLGQKKPQAQLGQKTEPPKTESTQKKPLVWKLTENAFNLWNYIPPEE